MKVKDLPYFRVTLEDFEEKLNGIIARIENAECVGNILDARRDYLAIYNDYYTMTALAYMRYTINTEDAFYIAEQDYYDEIGPSIENLCTRYATALLDSPLRAELEQALSPLLFRSMENRRKCVSPAVISDMVEENRLVRRYSKLMAGMEFEFRGEKLPRPALLGYLKNDDRETRREAMEVLGKTLREHRSELDGIFDELVHVRDKIAKKLGFKDFTELGYCRMDRLCYDRAAVEVFRENVLRDIAPAVSRLRTDNAKRMGLDRLMFYDNDVIVPGGDPRPFGKEEIFSAAREMYHAMGEETGAFIDMMLENDAFDVDARKNKWGGGYCTEFPKYRQPFILANFNGTTEDVDTMTHEAGHALNSYLCFDNKFALELGAGGMETAETHSMSMEFLAWPYMDKFFGADADKYRFMHALDSFSFIPYGTIVDKFQHIVYENPDMSPAERNAAWLSLEQEYRPHLHLDGIPYIEEGTRWQYQMHIYETPFYYIDYCLAETAAFAFLLASRENYGAAFEKYLRFSRQGGEKLWDELLREAGFTSPFTPGALKELSEKVESLINSIRI